MPTIISERGYTFIFYSNDKNEPIHIHVIKGNKRSKFWIKPVWLEKNTGFKPYELREIKEIIFKNQELIEEKWNEHFKK